MRAFRRYFLVLAVGLAGAVVPASVADAAGPFNVNNTADVRDAYPGDGDCVAFGMPGQCTLRAAVQEASMDSGSTTINLPAGTYLLNTSDPNPYPGSSSGKALQIASNVSIVGAGAATTIIRGAGASRVVDIQRFRLNVMFNAAISGVTITGGVATLGAGIFTGNVNFTLTDSIVSGNNATLPVNQGTGGGILAYGEPGYTGVVTLNRVTVSGNSAWQGGGIVNMYAMTMNITDSAINNNAATGPYAGGIRTHGFMTLTNTNVIGNYAGYNSASYPPGGGGIYSGAAPAPPGQVSPASTFTMNGGRIESNSVPLNQASSGGGLFNATAGTATLNNVVVAGNSAFHGGGILNEQGNLNLNSSEVRGNTAYFGGGLYNNDFAPTTAPGAVMIISRSTVSGNTATDTACPTHLTGGAQCGAGGGVFNENSDLVIANSTFADNFAATYGGGIYNLRINPGPASSTRLFNATVASNFAVLDGAGFLGNSGSFTSKNSIVADNFYGMGRRDCYAVPGTTMTSSGNNISTDTRCGFTQGTDRSGPTHSPKLLPLQINAPGTTPTMMPTTGINPSNAIGNGDNTACGASPVGGVDQRGVSRPDGSNCDIGAVEGSVALPAPTNAARPVTAANAVFSFRPTLTSGPPNNVFMFGSPNDVPLICDFNGDGTRSPTIVRSTGGSLIWFERQTNTAGGVDRTFYFGAAGDTPICGDWDGNGTDTPGILRNVGGARRWFQSNQANGTGVLTIFYFGAASDSPTFGDWDGNGTDTPGITRASGYPLLWAYRNSNTNGPAEGEFYFGINTDKPVVGDWDGNGADSPGIVRTEGSNLRWWTRNTIVNGAATGTFLFGTPGSRAFVWKGTGGAGF